MNVRIGITTSLEEAPPEGNRQTLRLAYVRAVEHAGGLPVIVPMLESEAATRTFADGLDGLVVTGGPAVTDGLVTDGLVTDGLVTDGRAGEATNDEATNDEATNDEATNGEAMNGETTGTLPEELANNARARRRSDGWLLDAFADEAGRRRPVLGICYGMQLVNARRGGRLWADVERQVDRAQAHSQKRGAETHDIALREGTHLRNLLGDAAMQVNTRHLQALASVGDGLRVSARASPDDVIEAVESTDGSFIGVQFHPERLGASFQPLFRHLVERAEQARPPASPAAVSAPAPVRAQRG